MGRDDDHLIDHEVGVVEVWILDECDDEDLVDEAEDSDDSHDDEVQVDEVEQVINDVKYI